jgi:spore maturation protein A
MNAIFTIIILLSAVALTVINPDSVLETLIESAKKGAVMALTLFCIYAVWMGVEKLAERSHLTQKLSRALQPITCKIFKTKDKLTAEYIAMNLSCNLLGLGGAATPLAVKAIERMENSKNYYAQMLLFIMNATSVQIIPTTVISLRTTSGSVSPSDIFLPSLICTIASTITATFLYILISKLWHTSSRL